MRCTSCTTRCHNQLSPPRSACETRQPSPRRSSARSIAGCLHGSERRCRQVSVRPRARIDDARSCTRSHCAAGGPTSAVNPKQCGRAQHLACGRSRAGPARRGLASFAGAPRRTQHCKSRRSLSSNCLNKMSTARAGTISADMFLPSSAIATGHGPNLLAGSAGKGFQLRLIAPGR